MAAQVAAAVVNGGVAGPVPAVVSPGCGRRGAAAPDHVALRGRPRGVGVGLAAVRALQPGGPGGVGARLQGHHLAPLARIRLSQL
jgi:hypothetical protein